MTDKEKKIIDDAISMQGIGGVRTFPMADGSLMTNYVPFRIHFRTATYDQSHKKYVLSLFTMTASGRGEG